VSSPARRSVPRVDDQSGFVATCAQQVRVTWLCHGQEQLASVHEAFQSLVRQRGTVCRRTLGQFSGRLKTEMFLRSYYAPA